MKLHRAGKVSQWQTTPITERNVYQRLAAKTGGTVTPGNIASSIGLALVFAGLCAAVQHNYWLGVGFVALGRLADVLDGVLAERTATKSPLGEAVDASFDKAGAFATLAVFAMQGLLPWVIALVIGLQSAANASLSLYAHAKNFTLHPSRIGKLSAVGVWLCILGFAALSVYDKNTDQKISGYIVFFVYFFAITAIAFSLLATYFYANEVKTRLSLVNK